MTAAAARRSRSSPRSARRRRRPGPALSPARGGRPRPGPRRAPAAHRPGALGGARAGRPDAGPLGRPGRPAPPLLRRAAGRARGGRRRRPGPGRRGALRPASPPCPRPLAAAAHFRGATHLGIGVVVRDEQLAWAVLLASERRAELDPFPRRVSPGSPRGAAAGCCSSSTVPGSGSPRRPAPPSRSRSRPTGDGSGRRSTSTEAGTWRVEVGGTGARGATVAAILEVSCGDGATDARRRRRPGRRDPEPPGSDPRTRRRGPHPRRRRTRSGRARGSARSRGRPRSTSRPGTTAQAMLAAGTVAHRLEGGGDLPARVAAAGVRYRSARENVARGDGAVDAHRAMVESPAHLANLLAPGVELMGLGIARGALPGGQPVVYLTEILVEPRDPRPGRRAADRGALRPARPSGAASRSSRCSTRSAAGWRRACSACRSSCSRPASPPRRGRSRSCRRRGSGALPHPSPD